METINSIELADEAIYPDEIVLKNVLKDSFSAYLGLLDLFGSHGLSPEWRYYRDGKAWLCKVQAKKRTIVWLSAWAGYMQASVYFPEKYLDRLFGLDISEETRQKIRSTKNVGKSKPCIFEIRAGASLADFAKIMQLKIASK